MRIILDYSWNHTGVNFPAWRDLVAKQRQSAFADWYEVAQFDDPATPDTNEFRYKGWVGVKSLPEWKKIGRPEGKDHGAIEGNMPPGVHTLVYAVTKRWLDPNGDGDPSDGIDGFRLDVAEMVPLGFWREYRRFVRGINPEAFLVGEVWFEKWPLMYEPQPWLQGDIFDAVMNYRWFSVARRLFGPGEVPLTPSGFVKALDSIASGIPAAQLEDDDEPDSEPRHAEVLRPRCTTWGSSSTRSPRATSPPTSWAAPTRPRGRGPRSCWCTSSPGTAPPPSGTATKSACGAPTTPTSGSRWSGPTSPPRTR
ncbi:MAG: hypothetical protein IPK12_19940 [Gemmatimonadetes bacterium]|nr:hypothetical protein [Gemmatimonadota bacterium]